MFVFKLQPSNKLSQLSPLLHFNRYCTPASPGLTGGLTNAPLSESQCHQNDAPEQEQRKGRVLSRLVAVLLTRPHLRLPSPPPPPLLSCIYANGCRERTRQTARRWKSMAQSLSVPLTNTVSHSQSQCWRSWGGARSPTRIVDASIIKPQSAPAIKKL